MEEGKGVGRPVETSNIRLGHHVCAGYVGFYEVSQSANVKPRNQAKQHQQSHEQQACRSGLGRDSKHSR